LLCAPAQCTQILSLLLPPLLHPPTASTQRLLHRWLGGCLIRARAATLPPPLRFRYSATGSIATGVIHRYTGMADQVELTQT
jgi:hypothetical protein